MGLHQVGGESEGVAVGGDGVIEAALLVADVAEDEKGRRVVGIGAQGGGALVFGFGEFAFVVTDAGENAESEIVSGGHAGGVLKEGTRIAPMGELAEGEDAQE